VTEEVWSWYHDTGSIHRARWPEPLGTQGDPAILNTVAAALGQARKAKSERRLSMKSEIPSATVYASPDDLARIAAGRTDLLAATHIVKLDEAVAEDVLRLEVRW
jgi:valyl-tRNA synthetase